jgi:hypothetical protein
MKVKLHESDWRMNSIVVGIFVSELTDPCKVRFVEMGLEGLDTVFEDGVGIVSVERFEKVNNISLLFRRKKRDRTSL